MIEGLIPPSEAEGGTLPTPVRVTMEHVRAARMCSRGARAFFERHGLDWDTFLSEGLPADVIEATGDVMAKQVVEVARGRKQ